MIQNPVVAGSGTKQKTLHLIPPDSVGVYEVNGVTYTGNQDIQIEVGQYVSLIISFEGASLRDSDGINIPYKSGNMQTRAPITPISNYYFIMPNKDVYYESLL